MTRTSTLHRFARLLLIPLLAHVGCVGVFMPATTIVTRHGEEKAQLGESDSFPRFEVPDSVPPIAQADVQPEADLLVARRGHEARAFLIDQMAYHHVAQGTLGGEPFVVMYCVVCDVGVGFTPVIDGRLLHMSAGGLSNGVVLARDDETGTYWSVTGEAVAGPLTGRQLPTWPLERTNVAAALADEPTLPLACSDPGWYGDVWSFFVMPVTHDEANGYMPPYFRRTMGVGDARCAAMDLGLGVVIDGVARFYPASELKRVRSAPWHDELGGALLTISADKDGKTFDAKQSDGTRPFQVWSRWYGFSASYPHCQLFAAANVAEPKRDATLALATSATH